MLTPTNVFQKLVESKLTDLYDNKYLAAANAISEEYTHCCTEEDFAVLWEDIKEL